MQQSIDASGIASDQLASLVANGYLSPTDFGALFREELKHEVIRQYLLGLGGRWQMTFADWGSIGGMLGEQYRYLPGFEDAIAAGELTEAQIQARARMYVNSAGEAYERARGKNATALGMTEELWVLGLAEHCFPAGTMISTTSGLVSIEQVVVGDAVKTLHGYEAVTKVYRHEFVGELVTVSQGTRSVRCTPNHPFLTTRGWVRADSLAPGDQAVVDEDRAHLVDADLALPNTHNVKAAGFQVNLLRSIALPLLHLPFGQWVKAQMTMPPVPVNLEDEVAKAEVNDELGFDEELRLERNPKSQQDVAYGLFGLGRLVAHATRLASKQFRQAVRTGGLRTQALRSAGQSGWVMLNHVSSGLVVDERPAHLGRQFETEVVGFGPDLDHRQVQPLGNLGSSRTGIMHAQEGNALFRPEMPFLPTIACGIVLLAQRVLAQAIVAADRTLFHLLRRRFHSSVADVAASAGTETRGLFPFRDKFLPAGLAPPLLETLPQSRFAQGIIADLPTSARTHTRLPIMAGRSDFLAAHQALHLSSPPLTAYIQDKEVSTVYNLEVEGAHHYIANGFVVHNCDDCLYFAGMGWQPVGSFPVPRAGETMCLTACQCTKVYRNPETGKEY